MLTPAVQLAAHILNGSSMGKTTKGKTRVKKIVGNNNLILTIHTCLGDECVLSIK